MLAVVPASVVAQTTASVRVVRTSVILEAPVGEATVLGSVAPGEVLEVLEEEVTKTMKREIAREA